MTSPVQRSHVHGYSRLPCALLIAVLLGTGGSSCSPPVHTPEIDCRYQRVYVRFDSDVSMLHTHPRWPGDPHERALLRRTLQEMGTRVHERFTTYANRYSYTYVRDSSRATIAVSLHADSFTFRMDTLCAYVTAQVRMVPHGRTHTFITPVCTATSIHRQGFRPALARLAARFPVHRFMTHFLPLPASSDTTR
jgi:hypothetical protein